MGIEHLIAFNIALLAAIASPGPALLVSVQTTLRYGRPAGIAVGLGLGSMAAVWTLMALLGLETIFSLAPWAYVVVKTVGALYLLFIAWRMWRSAGDVAHTDMRAAGRPFLRGVMINGLNPKAVLFAASVLVVIFPPGMTLIDSAIVVANHLAIELLFYTGLAVVMSTPTARNAYVNAKSRVDRVASVVLGALGLRLLLGR